MITTAKSCFVRMVSSRPTTTNGGRSGPITGCDVSQVKRAYSYTEYVYTSTKEAGRPPDCAPARTQRPPRRRLYQERRQLLLRLV